MQFGIFHELQTPRPWSVGDEARVYSEALEQAEIADRIGISHLWAQEHHFLEEYSHSSAPEVFLAACSQRTKAIRLGHGVALTSPRYNHPVRIAERLGALDILSGGRVEFGSGESSSRMELEGFQLPYSDKRAMWEEGLRETIRMMSTSPYPGHNGKYFAMPSRNIVPKPIQSPHPPLWLACSSRDTMKLAARLGMGALTFAFTDHREARFWVEEYYDVFRRECVPIGQAVNPNVAVLTGFMLDRDHDKAIELGAPGLRFFAYGLSHYFRTGVHQPAATDLYSLFEQAPIAPMAGLGGIGSPSAVAETFELFEEAGVDQMILLQQAGRYPHSAICDSLELFGREVLPAFVDRHRTRSEAKRRALEPYIERALERVEPFALTTGPVVEAYPLMLERAAASDAALGPTRDIGANALWQLHVGGSATRAGEKD